jgi:hypothetical protein
MLPGGDPRRHAEKQMNSYQTIADARQAAEKIGNGESYERAIDEMEKQWSEYCSKHVWD